MERGKNGKERIVVGFLRNEQQMITHALSLNRGRDNLNTFLARVFRRSYGSSFGSFGSFDTFPTGTSNQD